MEAICNVKAVVMDKTGTLTRGVFTVQHILPTDGVSETELLAMAARCESASTHPIAQSIRAAAERAGGENRAAGVHSRAVRPGY